MGNRRRAGSFDWAIPNSHDPARGSLEDEQHARGKLVAILVRSRHDTPRVCDRVSYCIRLRNMAHGTRMTYDDTTRSLTVEVVHAVLPGRVRLSVPLAYRNDA